MIKVKLENGKADIEIGYNENVKEQDEIVQLVTMLLLAFKQRVIQAGYEAGVANSDVQLMINKIVENYNRFKPEQFAEGKKKEVEPAVPKNVGPVAKPYDPMEDVLRQVDAMLKGDASGLLS